jgi:hypothetical protein
VKVLIGLLVITVVGAGGVIWVALMLRAVHCFSRLSIGGALALSHSLIIVLFLAAAPLEIARQWGSPYGDVYCPYLLVPGIHMYFPGPWLSGILTAAIALSLCKLLVHKPFVGLFSSVLALAIGSAATGTMYGAMAFSDVSIRTKGHPSWAYLEHAIGGMTLATLVASLSLFIMGSTMLWVWSRTHSAIGLTDGQVLIVVALSLGAILVAGWLAVLVPSVVPSERCPSIDPSRRGANSANLICVFGPLLDCKSSTGSPPA